jgi:polar amino acid transport system substrate-binding protein
MGAVGRNGWWPARISGPAFFVVLAFVIAWMTPAPAAGMDDHVAARAALTDLEAAIGEIVTVSNSYATDRHVYYRASQRAINALEGTHGPEYVAVDGNPGDAAGAIGHTEALLDRAGKPVWAVALQGAEANMQAAVAHLLDANHAHDLDSFSLAASRALTYLEVARGRPTEFGALGGMEGALANTVLGVPQGATVADGCAEPTAAPAYGVDGGWIAWVALPAGAGTWRLAENPGGGAVIMRSGMTVLPTAAASLVAKSCAGRHAAARPANAPAKVTVDAVKPGGGSPAARPLYTKQQAEAGSQIFAAQCVSCHGANLQGTSAPSVAGTDFITIAHKNGWSLANLRDIVVVNMPYKAPGTLSATAYADLLAFLLASNCYPSGTTPFPTTRDPALTKIALGPVPGEHQGENKLGVCPVP